MGNIEIRHHSNSKRRTQIFTDRKSRSPYQSQNRKSLTQRYQKSSKFDKSSRYSPIRFSKTSDPLFKDPPLTERKNNTMRQNDNNGQSPVYNQQVNDQKKSFTIKSKISKIPKKTSLQIQNGQQSNWQQNNENKIKPITQKTKDKYLYKHEYSNNSPINKNPLNKQKFAFKLNNEITNMKDNGTKSPRNSNQMIVTGKIVCNSSRRGQQRRIGQSINAYLQNRERYIQNKNDIQNKFQTREIIKKVRNFNDFLNQIKRKLKQDKQQTLIKNRSRIEFLKKQNQFQSKSQRTGQYKNSQTKNNLANQQFIQQSEAPYSIINNPSNSNHLSKTKSMRRIQVALKLQNEKLQLQKYRKLVQRELSKTHSIQNISLCTKNSGQKILTIQYQSLFPLHIYQNTHNSPYDNSKNSSFQNQKNPLFENSKQNYNNNKQPSQSTLINQIYQPHILQRNESRQKSQSKSQRNETNMNRSKQSQMILHKLKNQYDKMLKNMLQLGKTISSYEKQLQNTNLRTKTNRNDKVLIRQVSRQCNKQQNKLRQNEKQNKKNQRKSPYKQSERQKYFKQSERHKKMEQVGQNNDQQIKQYKKSLRNGKNSQIEQIIGNSMNKNQQGVKNNKKIQKIQNLFDKLNELQQQYQNTDRQIRQAINNSFSDSQLQFDQSTIQ